MLTFGTFLAADVTALLTVRTHSQSHLLGTCVGVCVYVVGGCVWACGHVCGGRMWVCVSVGVAWV